MGERGTWFAATLAAGKSISSAIDLGRAYERLNVQLPFMEACQLYLQASEYLGGPYYNLGKDATTDVEQFGRTDTWKLGGYRYIKVSSSGSSSSARLIRVRGISP